MRALIVGSATIDDFGNTSRVGGSVYYGGKALTMLPNVEVHVLTPIDKLYGKVILGTFEVEGINVHSLECESLPVFTIRFGRASGLKSRGCVIDVKEVVNVVNHLNPEILILAPVFKELSVEHVSYLLSVVKKSVKVASVDIQGLVREIDNNGISCLWKEKIFEVVNKANLTHGNLREFCFTNNTATILRMLQASIMKSSEASVAVTMDDKGLFLITRDGSYEVPALKVDAVDEVGAGDVFTAVSTYYLALSDAPLTASIKGSIAAALKVSKPYGRWFTEDEINSYVTKFRDLKKFEVTSV